MAFKDAIDETDVMDRSILLGNGFSIAWDVGTFRYDNLFDEEPFDDLSFGKGHLLRLLDTTDFEKIIRSLDITSDVLGLYSEPILQRRATSDAEEIRAGLCRVLARRHPDNAFCVTNDQYLCARDFLANFSNIFTVNYDLLSYWVVNTDHYGSVPPKDDGFRNGDGGSLVWMGPSSTQTVFYIHGGFHLFEAGDGELYKLSSRPGESLITQLRANVEAKVYPKVVTEGTTAKKLAKIAESRYLRDAHRRLSSTSGALFMHGVSLHENDRHVFAPFEDKHSRLTTLYVSIHGDPHSFENSQLIHQARGIAARRATKKLPSLEVKFYDSASADVWSLPAGTTMTPEQQAARLDRIPAWRRR